MVAGLMVFTIWGPSSPANAATLTFTGGTGETVIEVTFDPNRTEEQIRTLILLSPHVAGEYAVSRNLEVCEQPHSHYLPCGSGDLHDLHFFHNAAVNLGIAKKQLAYLETLKYPKELEPVVRYEKESLSFSRWLEQTRYDFYQMWDTGVLRRKYDGLDPSVLCASEIAEIERWNATSKDTSFELAKNKWRTCVLNASFKVFGSYPGGGYPMDSWKHFLEAYEIKEKVVAHVD
jgi:hypothetical protein